MTEKDSLRERLRERETKRERDQTRPGVDKVKPEGWIKTLFSSCPDLGMLYLIITPPTTAGRFGDFLS